MSTGKTKTSFEAAEKTLTLPIGKQSNGDTIYYKQLFFEDYITRAIGMVKLGKMELVMPKRVAYLPGFLRETRQNPAGIKGLYKRTTEEDFSRAEDWNNFKKITQVLEFKSGVYTVSLQWGDYASCVKHGGKVSEAESAIDDAYRQFKQTMEGKNLKKPLADRPNIKPGITPYEIVAEFGTRDNEIDPLYEIIFQYEILFKLMEKINSRGSSISL